MKAVFDVKPASGYKDDITRRYHFPSRSNYLDAARNAVGDWVLFREPQRNGGRRAYIAAARVTRVEPDPDRAGHYYANVADYLEFPAPVPFVRDGRYAEALLREVLNPSLVGRAVQGKSMRPILTEDFNDIVLAGLSETLDPANARKLDLDMLPFQLSLPTQPGFAQTVDRQVEQILLNRKIRDATFRLEVCRAYEDKCAVTGLRIINGGGRAEVQAAHIKPVAAGGPDVVQNGIALSATVHWLFDRHLISIDENHRLLVAHNRVPSELRNLFRPEHQGLHLPSDRKLWPHRHFWLTTERRLPARCTDRRGGGDPLGWRKLSRFPHRRYAQTSRNGSQGLRDVASLLLRPGMTKRVVFRSPTSATRRQPQSFARST